MLHLPRPSRRQLLTLGALAAACPQLLLAQSSVSGADGEVLRALVDRLIPAQRGHPGAAALGIDGAILAVLESTPPARRALRFLADELGGPAFLGLSPDGKDARIRAALAAGSPVSRILRAVLTRAVEGYYTRAEGWAALAYRHPQPGGYPDYAQCRPHRDGS